MSVCAMFLFLFNFLVCFTFENQKFLQRWKHFHHPVGDKASQKQKENLELFDE